jgi:hypothetical protein
MDQRTKWGNCSALGNLSFNWQLVMAPDFVLRYIVSHEMAPGRARPFPQVLADSAESVPRDEQARQWLVANRQRIQLMGPGAAKG